MSNSYELLIQICDMVSVGYLVPPPEMFSPQAGYNGWWQKVMVDGSYKLGEPSYGIHCVAKHNHIEVNAQGKSFDDVCDKALAELKKLLLRRVEDNTYDIQSAQMLLEIAKGIKD